MLGLIELVTHNDWRIMILVNFVILLPLNIIDRRFVFLCFSIIFYLFFLNISSQIHLRFLHFIIKIFIIFLLWFIVFPLVLNFYLLIKFLLPSLILLIVSSFLLLFFSFCLLHLGTKLLLIFLLFPSFSLCLIWINDE